ncbi:MAG: universal stress protein [Deltaproteobacteria bacterium]|nr:universal stress protein [Deltaproteobacteria bacterium]
MHIFFATDGSASARFAQAQILAMPWRSPVQISVMTAVHVPPPPFTSFVASAQEAFDAEMVTLRRDAEVRAEDVLAKARFDLEGSAASVSTRMHAGSPGATIVEMARACRVDLVAVGSRGLGPYKGYLLGSVSDHVANHARCSVLLAKTPPKRTGRYLLALDDSRYAVAVLRWLRELDLSKGAWIHLVKVFRSTDDFPDADGRDWVCACDRTAPAMFAPWGDAPEVMEAMCEEGLDTKVARVTVEVRFGQEVPEILASVRKFEPDLLLMGAKEHYSTTASQLGNVARELIDHALCSVLIVRPSGQGSRGPLPC